MRIIGIDLGTTNSAVAAWTDDGPRLIANAAGTKLTPSVVGLDDDNAVLVGEAARARLVTHSERTVASFKRFMGTAHQTRFARGHVFRPEELSALVLRSLKGDAEAELGGPIDEAVISVPAYFNDIQRKATLDAARLADLKVERLVNEPTAAALAYGAESREEGLFLVFDLGGGTFDVSLLECRDGLMEVHATAGDTRLGGDDFTAAIEALIAADHRLDRDDLTRPDRASLTRGAESLKRALGAATEAAYAISVGKRTLEGSLTRERFEDAVGPLLRRIRAPLERALNDSGRKLVDIDGLLMVGGATRMPVIRSLAARLFGRLPSIHIDPDTTVALGAAVQAGLKARARALDELVMTDVCPFTLGTSVTRNARSRNEYSEVIPIIERNAAVPISRSQTLVTIYDNQTAIRVGVYQGESRRPDSNVLLGEVKLAVPAAPAGQEGVEVRYTYDINGALEVEVESLSTKVRERRVFRNASNLSEAEIEERFAFLADLKVAPRDQAANGVLLARADALYEELLGDERERLAQLIARFEREIADPEIRDSTPLRAAFAEALEALERSHLRLGGEALDSPWALLGIEPTCDASLIRRAYARQVKAGADAARFQRLRRAREAALREAGSSKLSTRNGETLDRVTHRPDDSVVDDQVPPDEPRGRVVRDLFPLGDTEQSRVEAGRLRSILLASLEAGVDGSRFESAVEQAAMLPRGPRRELEAACVKALVGDWRQPGGELDAGRVARITPPLVAADRAFGWAGDDSVLTETLSPRDVDAVIALLDEAECRARSRRLPPALRMRRADAFAYFTKSAARRGVYEKAIARGRMPWRVDLFAAAAPHLWAYHHRLWRELVPLYLLFSLPTAILWLLQAEMYRHRWLLAGLAALFVAISAGAGLLADRMLFSAAERAVRRADGNGLYDKAPREAFLSERKRLPSPVFFLFLIFQILFPYRILQAALERLG